MKGWTAHVKPGRRPVLVKEGFSWGAFLFGPLWMLSHKAWIPAVLYGAALVALVRLPVPGRAWVLLCLAFLVGLLGPGHGAVGAVAARVSAGARADGAGRGDGAGAAAASPAGAVGRDGRAAVTMRVAVVDYGSGNLASASRALAEAARREGIAAEVEVTGAPERVAAADRVVLPGQGAFADCASGLGKVPGLREAIEAHAATGRPFLGICVGMQLMAERGLEHRTTPGFGWIAGEVAPMAAPGLRLPQMGWNELSFPAGRHALLTGLSPGDHVYFVHGYALSGAREEEVVATTEYGGTVPAMVARGNRAGTQFHVEKSQEVGLRILGNFLRWSP